MTLSAILEQQHQSLNSLLEILQAEREALCSSDPDGEKLAELAAHKHERLAQLEALDSLRASKQLALGFAEGSQGTIRAAESERCVTQYQLARDTARQVYRMNLQNGDLVHARMAWNEKILNFIREAREMWIYDTKGRTGMQQKTGAPGRTVSSQA